MSRGLGRIERIILNAIEDPVHQWGPGGYERMVLEKQGTPLPRSKNFGGMNLDSWSLALDDFHPLPSDLPTGGWEPSRQQRQATTRAMRSFVRKHPQYALMGGRGRIKLVIYEPADPLSTLRAKESVATWEMRRKRPHHVRPDDPLAF